MSPTRAGGLLQELAGQRAPTYTIKTKYILELLSEKSVLQLQRHTKYILSLIIETISMKVITYTHIKN